MTRLPIYLLGFLCLQLILTSVIYWQHNQQSDLHRAQPLVNFDQDKLDKVVIMAPDQTATITKGEDSWILPDLDGLPASATQLDSAVEKLAALTTNWPIATTQASHQRFELQEDNFQRRIQLFQKGNKVADLLLGSSPGFRKVHLRVLNDDNVYALPLNTFDFPDKDAQWLDKTLLAMSDINNIQGADYRLIKEQDTWTLTSPANSQPIPLDQDKAKGLVQALSNLRVLELVSEPPIFAGPAVKTLVVKDEQQRSHQLQFLEFEDKYYVKQQAMDKVFSLNQTDYQRMTGVDLPGLTLTVPEVGAEAESNVTSKSIPAEG